MAKRQIIFNSKGHSHVLSIVADQEEIDVGKGFEWSDGLVEIKIDRDLLIRATKKRARFVGDGFELRLWPTEHAYLRR